MNEYKETHMNRDPMYIVKYSLDNLVLALYYYFYIFNPVSMTNYIVTTMC